ncbi:MAG: hypothetical protein Q8Q12_21630 [bacterium]|nr:hypothetical protein [bacterium]
MPRHRVGKSKTDPVSVALAGRRKKALALRLTGASYPQIAEELGIGITTAFKDVTRAIREIPKDEADRLRDIELHSLNRLETSLWRRFLGYKTEMGEIIPGDTLAADRILRVKERRARMLGLDAPARIEGTGEPLRVVMEYVTRNGDGEPKS